MAYKTSPPMRENKGFILACCLLWASVLAISYFGESDAGFLLALFLVPLTLIGGVVLIAVAVIRLFTRHNLPWQKRLVPVYFSTIPVLAWVVLGTAFAELDKESTWLVVKKYDFTGSENFKFKKDGTYAQWRKSPLGSSSKRAGNYERRDSILTLHPHSENTTGQEVKLVIRPYAEFTKSHASSAITLVALDTTVQHY